MSAANKHQLGQLQDALQMVDGFSQQAFNRIQAMAALALGAFEQPQGLTAGGLQQVARVLEAIADQAATAMNDINVEAERMGCQYVDEVGRRRFGAICSSFRATEGGAA